MIAHGSSRMNLTQSELGGVIFDHVQHFFPFFSTFIRRYISWLSGTQHAPHFTSERRKAKLARSSVLSAQ
jgi:hypothetical protein